MFETIGKMAETTATNISLSRRGFLGRLGQGAFFAAGVVGGLLVMPGPVIARGPCFRKNCFYNCGGTTVDGYDCVNSCPKYFNGCPLISAVRSGCCVP
jgi:hypothetical protein